MRNESDPAAVIVIATEARRQDPPPPAVTAAAAPARRRHRWDPVETHRYRCRQCGMERRNWIDPETEQWFATFTAPGDVPRRSTHTPTCPGGTSE